MSRAAKMTAPAAADHEVRVPIVIVGGGLIGQSLALALHQALLPCLVIDAAPAPAAAAKSDGRTTSIARGSREYLEHLGVWSALKGRGEAITSVEVAQKALCPWRRMGPPLRFCAVDFDGSSLGTMIENTHLRRVMARAVTAAVTATMTATATKVSLLWGRRVTACLQDAAHVVLQLDDGSRVRADLVVAADGRHSFLRTAVGIGCAEGDYRQTALVTNVHHEEPHRGIAREAFLPEGPLALLPLPGGHTSALVWSTTAQAAERLKALSARALGHAVATRLGAPLGTMTAEKTRRLYPLSWSFAHRLVAGRVLLIGDAAQAVHPVAGQGLNLGLRDVAELAATLIRSRALGLAYGHSAVLADYARARGKDRLALLAFTHGMVRLFSNDSLPLAAVRGLGLQMVAARPELKHFFMRKAMGLAQPPRATAL